MGGASPPPLPIFKGKGPAQLSTIVAQLIKAILGPQLEMGGGRETDLLKYFETNEYSQGMQTQGMLQDKCK